MSPDPSALEGQRTDPPSGAPGAPSPLAALPTQATSSEGGTPPDEGATPGRFAAFRPGRREALWLAGGALLGAVAGVAGTAAMKGGADPVTRSGDRLDAKQALEQLTAGNARFAAGRPVYPDLSPERREAVAGGQAPFAAVLSCADSRVAPETVFDQGLGDLYTVRSLGQVVDEAVIGSLEYGIENLKVPLIVVLGHTQCGVVKAAVDAVETDKAAAQEPAQDAGAEGALYRPASFRAAQDDHSTGEKSTDEKDDAGHEPQDDESQDTSIDDLIEAIRPAVEEAEELGAEGDKLLSVAIDMNVDQVIEELKKSPVISKALKLRTVKLVGGTYGLRSGEVEWA